MAASALSPRAEPVLTGDAGDAGAAASTVANGAHRGSVTSSSTRLREEKKHSIFSKLFGMGADEVLHAGQCISELTPAGLLLLVLLPAAGPINPHDDVLSLFVHCMHCALFSVPLLSSRLQLLLHGSQHAATRYRKSSPD